ncbi:protein-glutamate O-methyltransferase CheR [Herbaspirillum sp. YR522]|uniref:CheR family methyltransferase n=1 Tax=Herbaspirillum sp. YR522 TaxID=1144342 RepID=UPI00026F5CAA|nr:protein-glutamate O-methyltransferase CheR [Herbaspirillum sp. YR522]EJN03560.1 methylase of chemotaxis methyl-accepting protein [Herbaspirillum sp. YR522]
MKTLHEIAARLKAAMGLDMATVGSGLIERVVRERMAALQLTDDQHYLAHLQPGSDELQRLIESAVVPETWFFRDREAMLALARMGREKLVTGQTTRLRILSLPCSTGEEPYSVAMALFDAGVPASAFHIDAIDIRTLSLEVAATGVYGRNSFRGRDMAFRDRYFKPQQAHWRIDDEVKAQVRFAAGNILSDDFLQDALPYDFILCRNVLIYFERALQLRVVAMLERMVKDDGTIFVGPAEGGLMLSPRVISAGIPLAFGFRKRDPGDAPVAAHLRAMPPLAPVAPMAPIAASAPRQRAVGSERMAAPAAAASAPDMLAQARRLADRGEFARADALCEQLILAHGANADAFHLKGLIADAGGDAAGAQRYYRKAVYLDPAHHEALQHLAALLQAQGDLSAARLMRQRAERVEQSTVQGAGSHG